MIRYDLICHKNHEFDGWFRDSAAYEQQAQRGLVACTVCGSARVEKQLMAPGIPAKTNRKSGTPLKMAAGPVDPRGQTLIKMMRELRQNVEANAEYVGGKFAEEARKIHYHEAENRGIRRSGVGNQNDESEHGDDRNEQQTPCPSDKTLETIDGVLEPLTIGRAHATSLSGRRSAHG